MCRLACRKLWVLTAGLICFAVAGAISLRAQGTTSAFTGVVMDQSGAVVPGASVTATNKATGVKFNATANSAGVYNIISVPPGTYKVEAKAKGFQTYASQEITISVDYVQRLDITLQVGAETQVVTVAEAAPLVSTEEGRLSAAVTGSEIQNMPLNGRNIYTLMQLIPGAVNSGQVDFENGQGTNINGTRMNFNGFLFDGLSNKGLSGGTYATPPPDFVQEFRIQTNNFDAQYSNSAGSITDVSSKSGTNDWHGDLFEFVRNDKFDARNFFDGSTKGELRLNQFGGTIGGPVKKNKMFVFGGVEAERFRKGASSQYFEETPAFHNAVISAIPNSTGALMYKNFAGPAPTYNISSVADIVNSNAANEIGGTPTPCTTVDSAGNCIDLEGGSYEAYTDPCFLSSFVGVGSTATGSIPWGNAQTLANNMAALMGVTALENADTTADIALNCPGMGFTAPGIQPGAILRTAPMEGLVNASNLTETTGPFYTGSKWISRFDYQGDQNRLSAKFYFDRSSDPNPTPFTGIRGFFNPFKNVDSNATLSYVRTFSPTLLNEFEAGHSRSQGGDKPIASQFAIPELDFDTGEPSFGSYNGYPQVFAEEVFNFKDMVTWVKGKHSMKLGAELKKNYENSEFNVGRPDYEFFDPFYFAGDLSYEEDGGVNPELTGIGGSGSSHLDTNIRAWRNYEMGYFIQDDWKLTPKLTLNLGLRWDYFAPHTEKYHHATRFDFPSAGLISVNCQTFIGTTCMAPAGDVNTPNGGFTTATGIFPSRYTNFAPRFGFAWDPTGNGKNSIRGGFAIQYESSFYNALSNSRWNLPFYSFNTACPVACGVEGLPTYGPTDSSGNPTGGAWVPTSSGGVVPTFSGPPTNPGQGPAAAGYQGNIMGWLPLNPNRASLTGIPSPTYKLPYVMNYFLSGQHQLSNSTVITISGVGTLSRHLFWAEDINRVVGGKLAAHTGTNFCSGLPFAGKPQLNPCFGHMRTWETTVNASYFGLQAQVERKFARNLGLTSSYTWGHSLDFRSSWHGLSSGGSATEANARGSSGYSLDPNRIFLEKGNSIYDVRQRWVSAFSWELPWMRGMQGMQGKFLGGWTVNSVLQLQSGFPFTVGASKDYNKDGVRSDRPNVTINDQQAFSRQQVEAGSGPSGFNSQMATIFGDFKAPVCTVVGSISCDGNEGRNTFRGPGLFITDFSVFKKIPLGANESRYLQFRLETFNLFNRTNLDPPDANLSHASTFGLSSVALDPREIQLALKLYF